MIGLVPLEDMVVNSASASLTQMVGGLLKTFFFFGGLRQSRGNCLDPQLMGLFIFILGVNQFDGQIESDSWVTQDWEGIFLILGQKMAEAVEHIAQLL